MDVNLESNTAMENGLLEQRPLLLCLVMSGIVASSLVEDHEHLAN